jgi:hypothetical protein
MNNSCPKFEEMCPKIEAIMSISTDATLVYDEFRPYLDQLSYQECHNCASELEKTQTDYLSQGLYHCQPFFSAAIDTLRLKTP